MGVRSKKARRDIMDDGWHRFMFNDTNLPDWFVKEEELHMKKKPDVDPETVAKYRERAKELNVKTIKKVVEAKARRRSRRCTGKLTWLGSPRRFPTWWRGSTKLRSVVRDLPGSRVLISRLIPG